MHDQEERYRSTDAHLDGRIGMSSLALSSRLGRQQGDIWRLVGLTRAAHISDGSCRTPSSELKQHRKRDDRRSAFSGNSFHITDCHPGGEKELLRVIGRDGTTMFITCVNNLFKSI
jgi:hypothetical protein